MSKIDEIKKIKEQLEASLEGVEIPDNKTFQEVFYELYDNWIKMKGEWEKEQAKKRKELEEKYRKEYEAECEEVEKAYSEVEEVIERKVVSLSEEVENSSANLHVLKSAYKKAHELNPNLSIRADEDKQTLEGIIGDISVQKEFLKGLKALLSQTKTSDTSEKGEE